MVPTVVAMVPVAMIVRSVLMFVRCHGGIMPWLW